jgi:hypothetical protein
MFAGEVKMKRIFVACLLIVTFIAGITSVVTSQEDNPPSIQGTTEPVVLSPREALEKDARWYADRFGVSVEEAVHRLELQEPIGNLGAMLVEQERETFAGLWVQNEPEYRVIVAFTANGEQTIQPYIAGQPYQASIEVRTVAHTLYELETTNEAIFTEITTLSTSTKIIRE